MYLEHCNIEHPLLGLDWLRWKAEGRGKVSEYAKRLGEEATAEVERRDRKRCQEPLFTSSFFDRLRSRKIASKFHSAILSSPTSIQSMVPCISWKQHGRPRTRWEVARVWRLGRRRYLLCADSEDPCEDWAHRRLVRSDATRSRTFEIPLAYIWSSTTVHRQVFP